MACCSCRSIIENAVNENKIKIRLVIADYLYILFPAGNTLCFSMAEMVHWTAAWFIFAFWYGLCLVSGSYDRKARDRKKALAAVGSGAADLAAMGAFIRDWRSGRADAGSSVSKRDL